MNNTPVSVSTAARFTQYWLPVLVMLIIQFVFSTDAFSSDKTSRFIVPVLKFVFGDLAGDRLQFWHHVVRKTAHVTEYCVLGLLTYRAFHLDVQDRVKVRLLTLVFVAGAAMMDEFHQSFVSSRTSSIFDVGFDCVGGIVSLLLMWVWHSLRTAEE